MVLFTNVLALTVGGIARQLGQLFCCGMVIACTKVSVPAGF